MSQVLRIVIFSDTWLPSKNGVVTSVRELCLGLADSAITVLLVVPGKSRDQHEKFHPLVGLYSVPSVPLSADGEIRSILPSPYQRRRIRNAVHAFSRGFRTIIHSHTEFGLGWIARSIARELDLSWVHSNHTLWPAYRHYLPPGLRGIRVKRLMQVFLRSCNALISPSVKSREWLADIVPGICLIHIVPNGLSCNSMSSYGKTSEEIARQLRKKWQIPENALVLMYAGRISAEKRVIELCRLLKDLLIHWNTRSQGRFHGNSLPDDVPPLYLFIAGGGPAYSSLQKEIKKSGISPWIVSTGWLAHEELLASYRLADIFCSLSRSEINPISLMEAASAGLPSVLLDDAAMRSIVESGRNGLVVQSEHEYAEAVLKLLLNRDLRLQMGSAARARSGTFSRQQHVESMLRVYCS